MVILVTGGAGYIGSHACKALANAGYTPVAYDNLVYGHKKHVKWGPLEIGDINDSSRLEEVFKKYEPKAVMHFAAYAYVGESVTDPEKYYLNNVSGTLTLLKTMRLFKVDKFIFSSTCATYGNPSVLPIPESHPQNPINPYGKTKLIIEEILNDYHKAFGLRSISLRYFNAAGADPDCEIGELHRPETHLIPLTLNATFDNSITIFGNDYQTKDGTCIRDYIHVTDLANAHVQALKSLQAGSSTTSYNLGNAHGFSILEIISTVEKVTGRKVSFKIGPRRAGDPPILIGDASSAMLSLNWKPNYSDINTIIATAWNWHRKVFNIV